MIAAISLFVVVFLSVLITRIATIALSHTGVSRESARFQARSALTGSGYTTNESEKMVTHPVRRRIILLLMLVGNAGLVTAVSSLILTFVISESTLSLIASITILVVGITGLWWAAQSQVVDRFLSRIIDEALRRYTSIDARDYAAILHLSGEYQIMELHVNAGDWIADKSLQELELANEGIMILGIQREGGNYLGTPAGSTKILPNDVLTVYGKASLIEVIDKRKKGRQGDDEHEKAVREHTKTERTEKREDRTAEE
jgi:hypothetical protein